VGIAVGIAALWLVLWVGSSEAWAVQQAAITGAPVTAWWIWPVALLVLTFVMGILAALGGVGGGVLFVPIVSGFFPFHLDFVRGCVLLLALSGALAS